MSRFPQTNMNEAIRAAQESAKAEIKSLEHWYNTRRGQVMQELDSINNAYYESFSEINTKWATHILELQDQPHDQGPMRLEELLSGDEKPSVLVPVSDVLLATEELRAIPTDDDIMAMESGLPRTDRPMTLSELATPTHENTAENSDVRHNDRPMSISELAIVSDIEDNDDESISVYNRTTIGVAEIDLSDDEDDEDDDDDEYHADHPSAILYDHHRIMDKLDIYNGYDEVYSIESDDAAAVHPTRTLSCDDISSPDKPRTPTLVPSSGVLTVAIVSDDEADDEDDDDQEYTENDENTMNICS
jgi:hypothetical protein